MSTQILDIDPIIFNKNFNKFCFMFNHNNFVDNPIFSINEIVKAFQKQIEAEKNVFFDLGDIKVAQGFLKNEAENEKSFIDFLQNIEICKAFIALHRVQKNPKYEDLVGICIKEMVSLLGENNKIMQRHDSNIFVTSPNRITAYHIDKEAGWLFQIQGTKVVYIFDPSDRDVLPEQEIEKFWAVTDHNAAVYRPQYQNRATMVTLHPGQGVHIPVGAGHWVQNGPEISISLNLNFQAFDSVKADIYRFNYWLRRLGFNPTSPGISNFRDSIKRNIFGVIRRIFKPNTLLKN